MTQKRKSRARGMDKHGRLLDGCKVYWSIEMLRTLRMYYPNTDNRKIGSMLNVSDRLVIHKAHELGLEKSPEHLRRSRANGGKNSRVNKKKRRKRQ